MASGQQFQTPEEAQATLKRAVELYHRDQVHRETVFAARDALNELDIPAQYFDAAQKELDEERQRLEQEEQEKKDRQRAAFEEAARAAEPSTPKTISEAIARIIHEWGSIYGPVIGIVLLYCVYSAFGAIVNLGKQNSGSGQYSQSNADTEVHDGTPTKWDFSSNRSDFLLSANPETDADMVKMRENGLAFERIHIRSFGRDAKLSNDASEATFYAKAYLNGQTVYFHGLHHLRFKARSKGISDLFVGFTDKNDTPCRFSEDFALTPKWKEYTVDLDKLEWWNDDGDWKKDGQVPPEGGLYIFTGDNTNDVKESGTVDFTDVELTN